MEKLLLGRLAELLILNEFHFAFGRATKVLTRSCLRFSNAESEEYDKPSKLSESGQDLSEIDLAALASRLSLTSERTARDSLGQNSILQKTVQCPPIVKLFCGIAFKRLEALHQLGPEFGTEFDTFLDGPFLETIIKVSHGTHFDVIQFFMFYGSLIWNLKNEIWWNESKDSTCEIKQESNVSHYTLWYRYLQSEHTEDGSSPDQERITKFNGFVGAWKQLISVLGKFASMNKEIGNLEFARAFEPEYFWEALRQAPRMSDLDPMWRDFIDALVSVIVRSFDHALDHPGRRRKFGSVLNKLPISMFAMTLKLLKPFSVSPKLISALMWRPKGSKTVFQKLAAIVCDMEQTNARLKTAKSQLSYSRRQQIESALLETKMTSRSSIKEIVDEIGLHIGDVYEADLEYAQVLIRKYEKDEFVDLFGGDDSFDTYLPLIQCILAFFAEGKKYCDISIVLTSFCDSAKQSIEALSAYDIPEKKKKKKRFRLRKHFNRKPVPQDDVSQHSQSSSVSIDDAAKDAQVHADVIMQLESIWYGFFQKLYPAMHAYATSEPHEPHSEDFVNDEPSEYSQVLEQKAKEYWAWVNTDSASLISRVLDSLNPDERTQLWQEVKVMARLCSEGIPEQDWPDLPILHRQALTVFRDEVRGDIEYLQASA